MAKKFWMVLGTGSPTFRHPSLDNATKEAERLAKAYPGTEFVVLESIAAVKRCDIVWDKHVSDMEKHVQPIPF